MIRTRSIRKGLIAGLLALAWTAAAVSAPDPALIRIEKSAIGTIPAPLRSVLRGVQELRTSWLALVPDDAVRALSEAGVPFEVLDQAPAGRSYSLVRLVEPEDADLLSRLGRVRLLDPDTALVWAEAREAKRFLPPRFRVAPLHLDAGFSLQREELLRPPGRDPPEAPADAPGYDPLIASWADQVSRERLAALIADLQGFGSREAGTSGCQAAGAYIYDAFARLGLRVEYDDFAFDRGRRVSRNVVATLPGTSSPGTVVIVCAHYDSINDDGGAAAPGADDNGSGTAAVLETARILGAQRLDGTVKFICFSAEEWNFDGSRHYAQSAQAAGETILGVVNLDMVAFTDRLPEDLDIVANRASEGLADRFRTAASRYASLATLKIVDPSWDYSDQSSFWDRGYQALTAIEDEDPPNPHYHSASDTLSTLNMDFAASVTKAALAVVAELARPAGSLAPPADLVLRRQWTRSLYAAVRAIGLSWSPGSGPVAGYNVYRAAASGGPYEKINAALVTGTEYLDRFLDSKTSYCYVVTAVDAEGRESGYSLEACDTL